MIDKQEPALHRPPRRLQRQVRRARRSETTSHIPEPRAIDPGITGSSTAGERLADAVTSGLGSWPFIAFQGVVLLVWIVVNTVAWRRSWDPYPFILLNLALSFQAAFSAPIILMSQNRQTEKDRRKAESDYAVDRRAEQDIAAVHARLDEFMDRQWSTMLDLQQRQLEIAHRVEALTRDVHQATVQHGPPPDSAPRV